MYTLYIFFVHSHFNMYFLFVSQFAVWMAGSLVLLYLPTRSFVIKFAHRREHTYARIHLKLEYTHSLYQQQITTSTKRRTVHYFLIRLLCFLWHSVVLRSCHSMDNDGFLLAGWLSGVDTLHGALFFRFPVCVFVWNPFRNCMLCVLM